MFRKTYMVCSILLYLLLTLSADVVAQDSSPVAYYVDTKGNDSNSGSIQQPFLTLQHALQEAQSAPSKQMTIYLRSGTYSVASTLSIQQTGKDSLQSLTISGFPGENVRIIGGQQLENSGFHLVTEPGTLSHLAENARGHIYVMDLGAVGINDFGTKREHGFFKPGLPSALELFYNGEPMTLARWPNTGFLPIENVIEKGDKDKGVLPSFQYSYNRPENWTVSHNIWVAGVFGVGWSYDDLPVASIDTVQKTVHLKDAASYGVYSSNDQTAGSVNTARQVRGYYFYNVLEELDTAGEYYVDSTAGKIYLWPKGNIHNADIVVSLTEQPLLTITNGKRLTVSHIAFGYTRGQVVKMTFSKNVTFDSCIFTNTGLAAITTGACYHTLVSSCNFTHTGYGAVTLYGGERKTLSPGYDTVQNCTFSDYSRLFKCYAPAVSIGGVGNSLLHCYIHDAPDQAVVFSGNNHSIAFNHFANVNYGFSDMGAVYVDRDPTATGTDINNNFFDNIESPGGDVAGLYLDDGSSGLNIRDNLFYKTGSRSQGAIHINGGGNNIFINNVFVECPKGITNTAWPPATWERMFTQNAAYLSQLKASGPPVSQPLIQPLQNTITNTIYFLVQSPYSGSSLVVTNTLITNTNPGFANPNIKDFRWLSIPTVVEGWTGWKALSFATIGPL